MCASPHTVCGDNFRRSRRPEHLGPEHNEQRPNYPWIYLFSMAHTDVMFRRTDRSVPKPARKVHLYANRLPTGDIRAVRSFAGKPTGSVWRHSPRSAHTRKNPYGVGGAHLCETGKLYDLHHAGPHREQVDRTTKSIRASEDWNTSRRPDIRAARGSPLRQRPRRHRRSRSPQNTDAQPRHRSDCRSLDHTSRGKRCQGLRTTASRPDRRLRLGWSSFEPDQIPPNTSCCADMVDEIVHPIATEQN